MVYKGPGVVKEIKKDNFNFKKENLKNIGEAVGINSLTLLNTTLI